MLLNIKEYVKKVKENLKQQIIENQLNPELIIVQVGNVEASNRYVRNKIKDCEEIGIKASLLTFSEEITTDELKDAVSHLANLSTGIIVQLPLPAHIDWAEVRKAIPANKDVDGFCVDSLFKPATPFGIMKYLNYCGYDVDGKEVVIIGRSEIVGKPLAKMMTDANATVTLCHSHTSTESLLNHMMDADLIVCAVGKAGFIKSWDWGTTPIIDVGINFVDGKLVGDVESSPEDTNVTPVPGGVGLLTRCALLENVIECAKINSVI